MRLEDRLYNRCGYCGFESLTSRGGVVENKFQCYECAQVPRPTPSKVVVRPVKKPAPDEEPARDRFELIELD